MATKTFACSQDALVALSSGGTSLGAGLDDHLPVGLWSGYTLRSLLQFSLDWSGVTQITKAELKVKTTGQHHVGFGGTPRVKVQRLTASWDDGTAAGSCNGGTWSGSNAVEWSNQPAATTTGEKDSGTITTAENTWVTIDITAIVEAWAPASVLKSNGAAGGAQSNYGLRIISYDEASTSRTTEFYAIDEGASNDPYILLTYTTNQAPTTVSLDSPANGATITDDTPNLVATFDDPDAGDTVAQYAIQVDDDPAFGSPVIDLSDQAIGSPANTVQVTHTCSALARGVTYYWRVQPEDNQGLKGAWSSSRQFYLATLPSTSGLSPTGTGFATIHNLAEAAVWADGSFAKPRLAFTYTSSSGLAMASYRIRVYDGSVGGNTVADTGTVTKVVTSGSQVTVDLATAMPRDTSRWWTVEVVDSAGGTSGESSRQQFRVQWGQVMYETNPGAGSASWQFALGAVAGGSVVTLFRTATLAGGTGTTTAWTTDLGALTPAAYLNVLVRMAPTTAGVNVTLGSMTFTYQGASSTPDNWVRTPSGEWSLSTAQRRFGAKSLRCAVVAGVAGDRHIYPYRLAQGDDIPVIPGVTYTWSVYVRTEAALTGGSLSARVYQGGSLVTQVPAEYVLKASQVVTDAATEADGWSRLTFTYTAPPGWTSVRPMVHYARTSGVAEAFYADAAKHEEGPVATPWQAGVIGAVNLDSGGIQVDGAGGGTFRLRGTVGGTRDTVELGPNGLVFGGDVEVEAPVAGRLDATGPVGLNATVGRLMQAGAALVPPGTILTWPTIAAPTGYLLCDGSLVSRTTYADLFGVISTTFGAGDGSTTFQLPDLRGRFVVGRAPSDALWDTIAETGGSKTHTHAGHANHTNHAALATHSHELPIIITGNQVISTIPDTVFGTGATRTRNWTASVSAASGAYKVAMSQAVSGGTPDAHSAHSAHDSPTAVPPFMALTYIIKT